MKLFLLILSTFAEQGGARGLAVMQAEAEMSSWGKFNIPG